MARPLRIEYPGAFYHVINRGNERKDIFISHQDRDKFFHYLKEFYERYAVKIHAYCLMDNHYHLILETTQPNLSKAMHFLNTSYTMYFNAKRKRSGHLFQGRYKAVLVEADEYLHLLSRYVCLNPVRAGVVKDPVEYPYSSYKYFVTNAVSPNWLETQFILSMFNKNIQKAKSSYKKFVLEAIDKEVSDIKNNITSGFILGSQDFIEVIKKEFIGNKIDKEVPVIDTLKNRPTYEKIRLLVENTITNKKDCRNISIYLTRKYTHMGLKEIASFYNNISDAGVSALYKRLDKKRLVDKDRNRVIEEMERLLKIET